MRIAILTDGIWPYVIGGMQKHSYYLVKYLVKEGHQILLFHTAQQKSNECINLVIFSEEERKKIQSFFIDKPTPAKFPGHYIYDSIKYSQKIKEVFNKNLLQPDFVIAKGFTGWSLLDTERNYKVAINIHGYEFAQRKADFKTKIESLFLGYFLKRLNHKADYIFSYGGKINSIILSLGISQNKIIQIPTGIEEDFISEIHQISSIRKFVFLGRWERRKGILELTEAIKRLIDEPFEFEFIGPIPEKYHIKDSKITYHGKVNDLKLIKKILKNADVLICPSYSEGMPNVILEGMATSNAIIATDVGAVSLMVDESNGILLKNSSVKLIYEAIYYFIQMQDDKLVNLKKNSLNKVRNNFLWSDVVKKMIYEIESRV